MDKRTLQGEHVADLEQPSTLSRRGLLQAAGIAGAAATVSSLSSPMASAAQIRPTTGSVRRTGASHQDEQPKPGGTLNAAMQVDVVGLDPHFISSYSSTLVTEQVYNGLIQLDENANALPDLAESWTVSPDGLVYDFKLRTDVTFHNGRAFMTNRAMG